MKHRLAIVVSHPTQYYSPWFRHLAERLTLKVFYLWDFGIHETRDLAFGNCFSWDIPLLDGYDHQFLPNHAKEPGTHHFRGLDNPNAVAAVCDWNPDVILLFGYNYVTHVRLIFSRHLRDIPMIFRGDSNNMSRGVSWRAMITRQARRLLFRRFDMAAAVGKANTDYLRDSGMHESTIRIVPHCVDNDRFQTMEREAKDEAFAWRRELGIADEAMVVLYAGKLDPIKSPELLLEAFSRLCSRDNVSGGVSASGGRGLPKCLLFVGSGAMTVSLKEAASKLLGYPVFFAPFQNQSEMPKVYATGDVFVLPSRSETWGLAINEAMNMGKPVIVSSHVGCGPDLVIPGETGWVFPAGDVEALTKTLADALESPQRLAEMGRKARAHIEKYSYERAGDALLEVLNEIGENQ